MFDCWWDRFVINTNSLLRELKCPKTQCDLSLLLAGHTFHPFIDHTFTNTLRDGDSGNNIFC